MFTVKAWMSHLSRPKMYYFANAEDAEKFADQLQANSIPATLGFDKSVALKLDRHDTLTIGKVG